MFVNSGATDIVLVTLSSTAVERAIAQCTSRWAMVRGHRLNTSIVLVAVHGLSGLFRAVSTVDPFTLSPPSHSVPVPNRPTRLCGCKATLNHQDGTLFQPGVDKPHVCMHSCMLCCFHSFVSTQTFERVPTALVDICAEIECPLSSVIISGRVWRKVPETEKVMLGVCLCG